MFIQYALAISMLALTLFCLVYLPFAWAYEAWTNR
jgi:hypothetical protein